MECPVCSFQNLDGMKFCGECGNKLEKVCIECNFANPLTYKFCGECGHNLKEPSKEDSEVSYSKPQSYTPKHLADQILTTRSSIEGERKLVTVLFADVANYTSISEKLDPEEIHQIMDGCFKILMDKIHKYEGTINQFTGDGIMALFGAPVACEDHAQRACYAAITIQRSLEKYSQELELKFDIQFKMRIGINSGLVVVGSIGDDLRMDYTAVGDTTNLAARMESTAKPGTILLSENTQKLVRDFFELESTGEIEVNGKKELQKAFQLIKTGEVETRIGASIAKGLTRFVGRKNSMTIFTEAFKKTKLGSGQIVGMVGEAGVGKSRLLLEMRNILPQNEFEYLEGRCLQYGGSIIYLPILDILKSIFNINDDDKEFSVKRKINDTITNLNDQFKSLNPSFQDILSLKVDDEEHIKFKPIDKREKIFEAIRDLLMRLSQDKPLVIAIEDLHWIDKTSEEFLNYFIDWLANTQILLILLYRPEYTHQWGSKSFYTKIGVDQLGMSSSGNLVKAILEEGDVAPELRQLILNRSAGNPLFMEEFTHALVENGTIEKRDSHYALTGNPEDIKIPDTIQGIIASRLDHLEDNLKRTMQEASVIGRDFAFKILQTITGVKAELKSYLLNLQGLEFIYEKNLFPELEYIFKHALTQEVAYNSLLQKRRKDIHEKIGVAIENLYPERLEEFYEMLAYHYSRSDNIPKACHYLKLSGDKARYNNSLSEAVHFYQKAINLLKRQPKTHEQKQTRLKILMAMAGPMMDLGYPESIFGFIEEGLRLSQELGDSKAKVIFQTYMGLYFLISGGEPKKGREYVEKSMDESELIADPDLIIPVASDMINSYLIEGKYAEVCQVAPKAISLIERTQTEHESFGRTENPYSNLSGYYGMSLGLCGNFEEGERVLEKSLSFAHDIDNLTSIAIIELSYGIFYWFKGDVIKQKKHHHSCIEYMEKSQLQIFLGFVWACLGSAYALLGQIETALQYAEKGFKIHTDLEIPLFLGYIHLTLSGIHMASENLEDAVVHAEHALELSIKNNERVNEAESMIILGRIIITRDKTKFDEARELILQGISLLDDLQIKPRYAVGLLYLGELYANSGYRKEALESLKTAETMFQTMGMNYWHSKVQEILGRL